MGIGLTVLAAIGIITAGVVVVNKMIFKDEKPLSYKRASKKEVENLEREIIQLKNDLCLIKENQLNQSMEMKQLNDQKEFLENLIESKV